MADLSSTYAIIGQDLLSGPAGTAEASLGRLEGRAGIVGSAFGAMATAAAAAGVALGAGLGIAIKTAADFEKQLSAISAVSSKAELDAAGGMKALSDAALQLGKDTSFSASQAAAGMEEMVKAGISITDVLGGGARAALDLAAAGGVEVAEAARVASAAMNSFALAGKDMTHIADELAGASVASATDVHQLGFALAAVGAVAHTVGIDFDDTVTAIAAMAQAGLKGSDAGTSLKTMLLNLTPRTKDQIAVAKELGIVTADGSNQFFDAAGNAKSMAEIAGVLQTATANLTKEQKIEALQTLFGTDAIRAAAIMANLGAAGMQKMAKDTAAAGSAQAIANERLNNFTGSMEKFRGSLETAVIIVGRAFLPALKRLADWATDALNDFIPIVEVWADALPAAIDSTLTSIEDFGRAAGQVFLELGQDVGAFLGLDLEDYAAGWDTWAGSMVRIGDLVQPVIDDLANSIKSAFDWVQDNSESIKAAFAGAAGAILAFTATSIGIDILTVSLAALLSPIGLVTIAGAAFAVAWVNDWGGIQEKTQEVVTWFTTTALPLIQTTLATFSTWVTETAVPAFQEWADWLQPKIQQAWAWFTGTALPAIQAAGAAAWTWVTGVAIPALTEWAGWLQPKITAAWTWFTATALPAIQTAGAAAWAWVTGTAIPALTELATTIQGGLTAAFEYLTGTAFPAIGTAAQTAAEYIQNLTTWVGNLNTAVANKGVYDDLATAFTNVKEAAGLFLGILQPGLVTGITETGGASSTTAPLIDAIATALKTASEAVVSLSEGLRNLVAFFYNVRDAIVAAQNALRDWIGMIPGATTPIPGIGLPIVSPNPIPQQPRPPEIGPNPFAPQEPIQGPAIPSGFDPNAPPPFIGPAIPPGFTPGQSGAPSARGPLASQTPWTEQQVRTIQQQIMGGEMPKPPPFDPNKSLNERMQAWAPTLQWLEANTGFSASSLAGLINAENQFGNSPLSGQGNNYFSITRSPYDTLADPGTSRFPTYPTAEANIARFVGLIGHPANTNYAPALAARGGDPSELVPALVQGGYIAEEPGYPVSNWVRNVQSGANQFNQATGGSNPVAALPAPKPPGGGLIPRGVAGFEQNQQDWDSQMADANAICGPHLAALFAGAVGRPPTRAEAVAVAEKMHIYSSAGSGSGILNASQFDEYATALIQQMDPNSPYSVAQTGVGGPTSSQQASELGQESLAGGAPIVGFNTPLHYFGATGYNAQTGAFHVGGTGTSIHSPVGKPDMTIAEMEDYGGKITNVITLLGDFQTANAAAGESVSTMGASVDTSTTSLSAIGAAIDPVVASMDTGVTSVSAMTDAIIASAAEQGVATETATAYSLGITSQQTALEGVLASYAATTPAAAELLTQLQSGAITTDQAAVAFAGLATTTATATGEIGLASDTMVQKVIPGVTGMQVTVSTATGLMSTDAVTAASLMQAGVITAAELMATGTQGVVDLLSAGVITTADLMRDGTVSAADLMNAGVTTATQTMQADASGYLDQMRADAEQAFTDTGTAADGLEEPLSNAADAFGDAGDAAKEAAGPVKQFASAAASVKPINMGDTVKNLQAVEKAALSAEKALTKLGEAGKHVSSGGGKGSDPPDQEGKGGHKGGGGDSVDATGISIASHMADTMSEVFSGAASQFSEQITGALEAGSGTGSPRPSPLPSHAPQEPGPPPVYATNPGEVSPGQRSPNNESVNVGPQGMPPIFAPTLMTDFDNLQGASNSMTAKLIKDFNTMVRKMTADGILLDRRLGDDAETMRVTVTAASEVMRTGVTTNTEIMRLGAERSTTDMQAQLGDTLGEMAVDTIDLIGGMGVIVVDSFDTMSSDSITHAVDMRDGVSQAAQQMADYAIGSVAPFADKISNSILAARDPSKIASDAVKGAVLVSFGQLRDGALDVVNDLADPTGIPGSIDEASDPSVAAAVKLGQEVDAGIVKGINKDQGDIAEAIKKAINKAVQSASRSVASSVSLGPAVSQLDLMPQQQTQISVDIDYDKLAKAVAKGQRDQNYTLNVHTNAPYEPITQDFALLEAMSRRES